VARSRRARPVRIKRDWVYTNEGYSSGFVGMAADPSNAVAVPLTVSQNARQIIAHGSPGVEPVWADLTQYQSSAAVPETGNQVVYAVDGVIMVTPADWAISTFFRLGMRLLHYEQDPGSGDMLAHAGYSMFEGITPWDINMVANEGYLREWYKFEQWNGSAGGLVARTGFVYPVRWRSRRGLSLAPNRALYLYMESAVNSRSLNILTRLRVRMSAGVQ